MKKKLVATLIVIGIIGTVVYYLRREEKANEARAAEQTTAVVKRGPIVLSVATTGSVAANLDVEIKCKASGEVIDLPFDISDPVKNGDLLVKLDPVNEERSVRQAEASLRASEARLEQAKQNLIIAEKTLEVGRKKADSALKSAQATAEDSRTKSERLKQLLEKKLASQEEFDSAQTASVQAAADLEAAQIALEELEIQSIALELKKQDVKLSEAQVDSDNISLSDAKQRFQDTKVYAPIDGVVSARNVQTGQIISSGISNVGGGTTVLTLSDLSRLFVLASVDESDIGNVRVEQPANITADAFAGINFEGKVVRIATKGVSTANVVTFEVKIEILGKNKHFLKPEMTANVEIIVDRNDDTILVPVEAIVRKGKGRFATVVKPGASNEERPVTVGINDGVNVAISSGLKEGETVLVRKGEAESRWRSDQQRGPTPMMFGAPVRR